MIKLINIIKEIKFLPKGKYPEKFEVGRINQFKGDSPEDYYNYIIYIIKSQGIKSAVQYFAQYSGNVENFNGYKV